MGEPICGDEITVAYLMKRWFEGEKRFLRDGNVLAGTTERLRVETDQCPISIGWRILLDDRLSDRHLRGVDEQNNDGKCQKKQKQTSGNQFIPKIVGIGRSWIGPE